MTYADTTNFSSIKQKMKEALQSEGIITEELFDKKLREILSDQNPSIKKDDSAPGPSNKPQSTNKAELSTKAVNPDDEDNSFGKAIYQMLSAKKTGEEDNKIKEDNMNEDDCFSLI